MAAGGQEQEEQEPMDLELGGLDIDAALPAEPEAHVRLPLRTTAGVLKGMLLCFSAILSGPQPRT